MGNIKLNDKSLTEQEFEVEKKKIEEKKGVILVKISEDTYKSRIQG